VGATSNNPKYSQSIHMLSEQLTRGRFRVSFFDSERFVRILSADDAPSRYSRSSKRPRKGQALLDAGRKENAASTSNISHSIASATPRQSPG
jgi:hypothetical protein